MPAPIPVLLMVRELGIGGCERDLAKIALHLDRSRFTPHVGCFIPEGLRESEIREAGVPIAHIGVESMLNTSLVKGYTQFANYVRRHGIKVVHAFDVPTSIFGIPAARLARVPVAISSQLSYRDLYYPRDRRLLRISDRLANAVVVNSWAVHKHLLEDERVKPEKIFVSWNGVDTSVFRPAGGERPAAFTSEHVIVGTVAALRPEKQVHLLVRAFARAARQYPSLRCLIVGSGPEKARIEDAVRETGLADRFCLQPARPDVAAVLSAIDVFVHASRSESFPNAVLEAMACGCAVLATRVGGIPELIEDGTSGLLYTSGNEEELASAIGRLASDPSLRQKLASAAHSRAQTLFPISRAVERLSELYTTLFTADRVPVVARETGSIVR